MIEPRSNDPRVADGAPGEPKEWLDPSRFRVFKRTAYFFAIIWLCIGAALLSVGLVDAFLRAVLKPAKSLRVDANAVATAREAMAANGDERGYWLEHEAARETQWRPYVYFRRKPYTGKLINVDANGFRLTLNPAISAELNPNARPTPSKKPNAIWLFGGSTVWGTGVSDAHTLASELARLRAQSVLNFGETGYVSAQSQLAFMASLRCPDSARPELAVFVDGVNDVYAALQSGAAGIPQNEINRQIEFNVTRNAQAFGMAMLERLQGIRLLQARLFQARLSPAQLSQAQLSQARLSQAQLSQARLTASTMEPDVEKLAQQVARNYLAVVAQTRAIANAQGVRVLFIWQPSLFDKAKPTDQERGVIGSSLLRHRDLQLASTRALKAQIQSKPPADLLVLDTLFNANSGPIFIDFAHTGPLGNALMAQQIAVEMQKMPINAHDEPGVQANCPDRPLLQDALQ